jgi:hypothetical protein
MSQHFLLIAGARSMSSARIISLSDDEVEMIFRKAGWAETDGETVCPKCGGSASWRIVTLP